jgi:hypothetical protein
MRLRLSLYIGIALILNESLSLLGSSAVDSLKEVA